ncbi:MAG: hypothetical protein ACI30V_01680 [Muribaculaceae bacterium]
MLNEKIFNYAMALLLCAASSCSGGSGEQSEALDMLAQAKECISKNPQQAISLIDSLNTTFPKQTEVRRKAMHVRTLADSVLIDREFALADSTIKADSVKFIELKPRFAFVKTKDMVEGYYVAKTLQGKPLFERTGIEPRVDELGNMFIVTCVFGAPVQHTHLVARASGSQSSTADVPHDGATNYRYTADRGSCEMATFHFDKCADFCKFVAENNGNKVAVDFVGKGKTSITLSADVLNAFSDTYEFAQAMSSGKNAVAKMMYLNKKRDINRRQMAQTKTDADE